MFSYCNFFFCLLLVLDAMSAEVDANWMGAISVAYGYSQTDMRAQPFDIQDNKSSV